MERDFGAEIDGIKEQLREIRKVILRSHLLPRTEDKPSGESKPVLTPAGREQLDSLRDLLIEYADEAHETGAVAYAGTFCCGEDESTRQSIWAGAVRTDALIQLNDNHMVEKVLTSIGNRQRLAILLALLKKPMTVNQLMAALGSNTTGQVHHHLKPLQAADLIREEKGVYAVLPHRVQGILMLLTGVQDLTDTRYTSGTWEEQAQ